MLVEHAESVQLALVAAKDSPVQGQRWWLQCKLDSYSKWAEGTHLDFATRKFHRHLVLKILSCRFLGGGLAFAHNLTQISCETSRGSDEATLQKRNSMWRVAHSRCLYSRQVGSPQHCLACQSAVRGLSCLLLSAADSRQTLRPCRCKRAAICCSRCDSCPSRAAARCVKPLRASQYTCHTIRCTGHVMERDTRFTCFAYCTYMGKAGRGIICLRELVPTDGQYTQRYTMVCIVFCDNVTVS